MTPTTFPVLLQSYLLALLVVCALVVVCQSMSTPKVLIYTAAAEYVHDSTPTAVSSLTSRGPRIGVEFSHTEDKNAFTDDNLSQFDAVMFMHNTGEVLDDNGKAALQRYFNKGGNFIGVHSAADCLRTTEFFNKQLGAHFDYHPELQNATVSIVDNTHPSTSFLPSQWNVRDEMYNFKSDPRAVGAKVILVANEASYVDDGERKYDHGSPHPLAWYQNQGAGVQSGGVAGRSFYTSLGHMSEAWQDDAFMTHVLEGVQWALASNTTRAFNETGQVGNPSTSTTSKGSGSATNSAGTPA